MMMTKHSHRKLFLALALGLSAAAAALGGCTAIQPFEYFVLDTPMNFSVTDDWYVTWDEVENAESYLITVTAEDGELEDNETEDNEAEDGEAEGSETEDETTEEFTVQTNSLDMFLFIRDYITYTMQVFAVGDGNRYETSEGSELFSYTAQRENTALTVGTTSTYAAIGASAETAGLLIVPSEYNGVPITTVMEEGFADCTQLTGIILPDTVTYLGAAAFAGCTSLKRVWLGDGLTDTDYKDGYYDSGLGTFQGCTSLTEITIPDSLTALSGYMFCNCTSLKTVSFGSGLTSLGVSAFENTALTEVSGIPSGVGDLYYTFMDCTSLKTVNLPDTIDGILYCTFTGCTALTEVPALSATTLDTTFSGCTALKEVTLLDGTEELLKTFYGCSSLTTLSIPASVTSLTQTVVNGCESLTSISIDPLNERYSSDGNCLIEGTVLLAGIQTSVIPDYVTEIGNYAFRDIPIEEVTIPGSVTRIGNYAFYGTPIEEITIPESVTEIGLHAFASSGLKQLTLSGNITEIGNYAFYGCENLVSVTIGDDVEQIPTQCFADCTSLESLYLSASVMVIREEAFSGCASLTQITVDKDNPRYYSDGNCVLAKTAFTYTTTTISVEYEKDVLILGCMGSVIPSYVKTIGRYAFAGLQADEIVIPEGIETLGTAAYADSAAKTVTLPSTLIEIGASAFSGCENLTEITIPSGVETIGGSAFAGCDNLTEVTIPSGVKTIGASAFKECYRLSVLLPSSVETIGAKAFATRSAIYTDALSSALPEGWDSSWNGSVPVVYGCTFGYDGGVPYVESFVYGGSSFSIYPIAIPYRSGYTFSGWALEEGGEAVYTVSSETYSTKKSGDVYETEYTYDACLTKEIVTSNGVGAVYYAVWEKA